MRRLPSTVRTPRALHRFGVRARITFLAGATVVVPLVLVVLGVAVLLHQILVAGVAERASQDATQVAAQVTTFGPAGIDVDKLGPDARASSVRVVTTAGAVVFAWPASAPRHLDAERADTSAGRVNVTGVAPVPGAGGAPPPVVAATRADHAGRTYVVTVAMSQNPQHDAVTTAVKVLLGGIPLFLVLAALTTWITVGRALGPVERMRETAQRISTRQLSTRLPEPVADDELGRLARTLNDMLGRLEAGRDAQRRFVADASHEMRSPLGSLRTSIQLGRSTGTAQRWNDLAVIMDAESSRLQRLVDDLLTLSKADERGVMPIATGDVDLDDIAMTEARRVRAHAGVSLEGTIHPARVDGDALQLARALRNLVDNAVRAADHRIDIDLHVHDGMAWLTVDDDGPGVPDTHRAAVFDRFVRLDDARQRDSGGSGLGLPIVAEVARAHGGHVEVARSPRLGGARFVLAVPVSDAGDP